MLGATGTIGRCTLEVLALHPERFTVFALTANKDVEGLYAQCLRHTPRMAVMADLQAAEQLRLRLRAERPDIIVQAGETGLQAAVTDGEVEYVMAAIVGAAGLLPALAAAGAGKRLLLANKEALIMAGEVLMQEIRRGGGQLLPIDSEHNAAFQCMPEGARAVRRITLTASGGPFRETSAAELKAVTPEQAMRHPNWTMGPKITIDSATLMNKGLEVIEACRLFDLPADRVEVLVHAQSVVHALVEYTDGSVLAHLGTPDMRIPIAHALGWPEERLYSGAPWLDLCKIGSLQFEPPDTVRFPCLRLAREALAEGGTATAVLNAANEVAVEGFIDGRIGFTEIPVVIEASLDGVPAVPATSLDEVLAADAAARVYARQRLEQHAA